MNTSSFRSFFCITIFCMLCGGLRADDWSYSGSGNWFTPENWSSGTVPNSGTDVFVTTSDTAVIDQNGATSSHTEITDPGNVVVTGEGSEWSISGSLRVSGSLAVQDGGLVTGNSAAVDGIYASVVISGSGSQLRLSNTSSYDYFGVGTQTTGRLTIENGGAVYTGITIIGSDFFSSSGTASAEVLVTGAGSSFDSLYQIAVGMGSSNTSSLTVADGAYLTTHWFDLDNGIFTISGGATADTAQATVTGQAIVSGAGSQWSNTAGLQIGGTSFGIPQNPGSLRIEDGGRVVEGSMSRISEESTVTVTGMNSEWQTSGTLTVSGSLTIDNGGLVRTDTALIDGENASVVISGSGSQLLLSSTSSSDYLGVGTQTTGRLTIENGGAVSTGITVIGSDFFSSSGTASAEVLVTGVGSSLDSLYQIAVGMGSSNTSSLTVADGATLTTEWFGLDNGIFTVSGGALANTTQAAIGGQALVSGTGSQWSNTTGLQVGGTFFGTPQNPGSLRIEDGGRVADGGMSNIGENGSTTVTGAGSEWLTSGTLTVSGSLAIANGGRVATDAAIIDGEGASVRISGTGSEWSFSGTSSYDWLLVGTETTGRLTIENGGRLSAGGAFFGSNFYSSGTGRGDGLVTGVGSSLTLQSLELGFLSTETSTLTVADGAALTATWLWVDNAVFTVSGGATAQTEDTMFGGQVVVSGTGSQWSNTMGLRIAQTYISDLPAGSLRIEGGGKVTDGGFSIIGSNGAVAVTGAGSEWNTSGTTTISGSMAIENGGFVTANAARVDGTNASVVISGTGSEWKLSSSSSYDWLVVGTETQGSLTISNGGKLNASITYLGGVPYSSYDAGYADILVTGTGSEMNSDYEINLGWGSSNTSTLTVADGAALSTMWFAVQNGTFSVTGGATANTYYALMNGDAIVSGTGSLWSNTTALMISSTYLNDPPADATLRIEKGGKVTDGGGSTIGSTGLVTVAGVGSEWNTSGTTTVSGRLAIEDGGVVTTNAGVIDGIVTVDGVGSRWAGSGTSINFYDDLTISGSLGIHNGGVVTSNHGVISGETTGRVVVSGTGSEWISSSMELGSAETGQLVVESGGQVTTGNLTVHGTSESIITEVTVTGTGSRLTAAHGMQILSWTGTNSVTVSNGASLSVGLDLDLGVYGNGAAILNIGDIDLTSTGGDLQVSRIFMDGGSGTAAINFNQTDSATLSADVYNSGYINQRGTGLTILLGNNANFSGTTTITSGTLQAGGTALGSSKVIIENGGTLFVRNGGLVRDAGNPIQLENGTALFRQEVAALNTLASFTDIVSSGGTRATELQILYGDTDETRVIDTSFSSTPSTMALNDGNRISDVLHIDGTGDTVFVMQLSYTQAAYDAAALAGIYTSETQLYLGYLQGNEWVNAGSGPFVDGAWSSMYTTVGAFGVDTVNNVVWAVVDHNSEYSVVPEPSTFALVGLSLGALVLLRRRRNG